MACRTLDVTVLRAEDIKVVNFLTSMDVYAVISISGDPRTTQTHRTTLHVHGHRNPRWNQSFCFTIPAADPGHLALHVCLLSDRLLRDLEIGEVYVPLRDLLAAPPGKPLSFPVCSSSGDEEGCLFLSYQAGHPIADPAAMYEEPPAPAKAQEAVAGYPPPPSYAPWGPYPPYMPPYGYDKPPPPQPKNARRSAPRRRGRRTYE